MEKYYKFNSDEIHLAERDPDVNAFPDDKPAGAVARIQRRKWKMWINVVNGRIFRRKSTRINDWSLAYDPSSIPSTNDFFRSGTGSTFPDGTTDDTENIARTGNLGLGFSNPSTVAGKLDVQGSEVNRVITTSNFLANGVIGTAAATVDVTSTILIPQTTANIFLTLPNPTNTTAGRKLRVVNTGTERFRVAGVDVYPTTHTDFVWSGTQWIGELYGTVKKFQTIQSLIAGNNLITHDLNLFPPNIDVQVTVFDSFNQQVIVRKPAWSNNAVTLQSTVAIPNATIVVEG